MPRYGMISAAPDTRMTFTFFPLDSKNLLVTFGKEVAILLPSFMSSTLRTGDSSGTATASLQYPNPRSKTSLRSWPDSASWSRPVMPMSMAPLATNSGRSWARTNMTSMSWFLILTYSFLPMSSPISRPDFTRSSMVLSFNLPLFGTPSLRVI